MTLAEGKIGHDYIIETLDLPDQTEKRLQALGMIEGTEISVLNNKNRRDGHHQDAQHPPGLGQGHFVAYRHKGKDHD